MVVGLISVATGQQKERSVDHPPPTLQPRTGSPPEPDALSDAFKQAVRLTDEKQISELPDDSPTLRVFYAFRGGSPAQETWQQLIDQDILRRKASPDILARLIHEPAYEGNLGSVCAWVAAHPSYSGAEKVLNAAITVYEKSRANRDPSIQGALANLLEKVGGLRHAYLFDELEKDGYYIDLERNRFLKRIKSSSQTQGRADNETFVSHTDMLKSGIVEKAQRESGKMGMPAPDNRSNLLFWVLVVIAATVGAAWLLLRKRK